LEWDVVPSGNEDTTYFFEAVESDSVNGERSYGVKLMEKPLGDMATAIGSFSVFGGDKLTATMAEPTTGNVTVTVNHDKLDCKETSITE
jgi:hypothetical protein